MYQNTTSPPQIHEILQTLHIKQQYLSDQLKQLSNQNTKLAADLTKLAADLDMCKDHILYSIRETQKLLTHPEKPLAQPLVPYYANDTIQKIASEMQEHLTRYCELHQRPAQFAVISRNYSRRLNALGLKARDALPYMPDAHYFTALTGGIFILTKTLWDSVDAAKRFEYERITTRKMNQRDIEDIAAARKFYDESLMKEEKQRREALKATQAYTPGAVTGIPLPSKPTQAPQTSQAPPTPEPLPPWMLGDEEAFTVGAIPPTAQTSLTESSTDTKSPLEGTPV